MGRKKSLQRSGYFDFSKRERQILEVLYTRQRATARDIREAIADPPSYSAVRATLHILEAKGCISHKSGGSRYLYFSRETSREAQRSVLRYVIRAFFGDSVHDTMRTLVEIYSENPRQQRALADVGNVLDLKEA